MVTGVFFVTKFSIESAGFVEGTKGLTRGYEKAGYQGAMGSAGEMSEEVAKVTAYVIPCNIVELHAYARNIERILERLEKGVEVRDLNMVCIDVIPLWGDLLRDEPHYQELL